MTSRPRLSLCMIVKNEAQFISNCLLSVRPYVDEMIIVDTGSTDETKQICIDCGATVYSFPWTDSFCDARNYGLQHASGDWILWLDADERFFVDDAEKMYMELSDPEKHLFAVPLINYYGALPADPNRAYVILNHRLFRNHIGLRFENDIHEQLNAREVLGSLTSISILPCSIDHFGYMDSIVAKRDKHTRNMTLLQQAKQKQSGNPWTDYHIASEHYRTGNYNEAFDLINSSMRQFLQNQELPPSLLYKLKYEILIILGSFDGAWPAIDKAIELYPDYVDLHFYKGLIMFSKQSYKEAIASFQTCLALGDAPGPHLTLRGLGSFQANFYIGECYEKIGKRQEAKSAYEQTLFLCPEHELARQKLADIQ